jgi:Lar family restriction alleviation protein
MTDELLPCPFCGNAGFVAELQDSDYAKHWYWYAGCTDCTADVRYFDDKGSAVNAWNTRMPTFTTNPTT